MKKYIKPIKSLLVIFFFIIKLTNAYSQSKIYVGFKGGSHINTAYLKHSFYRIRASHRNTVTYNLGLSLKYFSKGKKNSVYNTGVQLSALFIQKGWAQFFDKQTPNYKARINMLEIPFELIGYFGNRNKYFITGGPFVSFLLSSSEKNVPDAVFLDSLKKLSVDFIQYDSKRDYHVDYGVRGALGVFRDFGIGAFQIEGFISYGLRGIFNAGDLTERIPDYSNLFSYGFTVGYFIPFGKLNMRGEKRVKKEKPVKEKALTE